MLSLCWICAVEWYGESVAVLVPLRNDLRWHQAAKSSTAESLREKLHISELGSVVVFDSALHVVRLLLGQRTKYSGQRRVLSLKLQIGRLGDAGLQGDTGKACSIRY